MRVEEYKYLCERLDAMTDRQLLDLHREVCRRASAIYAPMYREKQAANHRAGMAASAAIRTRAR
jgi:hypothetical protein